MNPTLSVILVDSVELDPSYLDLHCKALAEWNRDGLEDCQLLIISQRQDPGPALDLIARHSLPAALITARHEWVNGYPVWDVLAATRATWPQIQGSYVTFNHPEFIWGPGRLRKTIDWLKANRPYFGIGNLRRPGRYGEIVAQKTADHCVVRISEEFRQAMSGGDGLGHFESLPTCWWMFWSPEQKPGANVNYIEDVFFADKEWLDSWSFVDFPGELPFQDVYDLIGNGIRTLARYELAPTCSRADQTTNRMIHLWHPKKWDSWTPAMKDWFLSQPERWRDTKFLDATMWDRLIGVRKAMPKDYNPVNTLRNAPGGTVTRYAAFIDSQLKQGVKDRVKAFYAAHGRARREQ